LRSFSVGTNLFDQAEIMRAVGFSGDLKADLAELPSWIAFWGSMVAQAKAHADEVETLYRKARDAFILEAATVGIDGEKKVPKTVAEVMWRDHKDYENWWERQRRAEYAWNASTYVYEAVREKRHSLVAMQKLWLDEITAYQRQNG
jgi:hypothetical protein